MANNAFYKRMWDEVLHKGFWKGDIWNLVLSGEIRCHHLNISTVRDESLEPQYYVGMLQAVHFMAQHDILTGLANRSMLMEQLERHLALAKRHGRGVALLYLDLDGFKSVNDQFGHNVCDQVLQIVADRFRNVIREGDLLCRQGGDEFVVLVPEAGQDQSCAGEPRLPTSDNLLSQACSKRLTIRAIRAKEPARAINKAMVMAEASTTATIIAAEGSKPSTF